MTTNDKSLGPCPLCDGTPYVDHVYDLGVTRVMCDSSDTCLIRRKHFTPEQWQKLSAIAAQNKRMREEAEK